MFVIIGLIVVIGAILGGYLMEHGKITVLLQPAELVIILGAGIGSVLIANPVHILKNILSRGMGALKPSKYTKKFYLNSLTMFYELLNKARKGGLLAMEADVEEPEKSEILNKNKDFMKDHHTRDFMCDTLRMAITGGIDPFDLDQMMEIDLEVSHQEATEPVAALSTMADSLPGLGIVAAVLGVVITMGALGGPPEEIGHKVAAALVGTFLGILLSYGVVSPLAANIEKTIAAEGQFYQVLRAGLMAFARGMAPMIAVEFARRAIPHDLRPSFKDMEAAIKGGAAAAAQAKAA